MAQPYVLSFFISAEIALKLVRQGGLWSSNIVQSQRDWQKSAYALAKCKMLRQL